MYASCNSIVPGTWPLGYIADGVCVSVCRAPEGSRVVLHTADGQVHAGSQGLHGDGSDVTCVVVTLPGGEMG